VFSKTGGTGKLVGTRLRDGEEEKEKSLLCRERGGAKKIYFIRSAKRCRHCILG
jgi:hypothetical protein